MSSCTGEMTNGGFATTSPNRSSRTGSNRSPCRQSTFSTPFSAALRRARRSARGFRSRPTTRSLWRAARNAWAPEPVPRSRAGLHRPAHGQRGERPRRRADLDDVVCPQPACRAVRCDDEPSNGCEGEPRPHDAVANGDQAGSGELAQVDRRRVRRRRSRPARCSRARKRRTSAERGSSASGRSRSAASPSSNPQAAVVADEPVDAAPRRSRPAPGVRGASRVPRSVPVRLDLDRSCRPTLRPVLERSAAADLVRRPRPSARDLPSRHPRPLALSRPVSSRSLSLTAQPAPSWTPPAYNVVRARAAGSRGRSRGPAAPSARRACPTRRAGRARAR